MLHEALGIAPVVAEQPELVVAEGSLYVNRMANATAPVSAVPTSAAPVSPVSTVPYPSTQGFAAPPTPVAPVSAPAYAPAPVSPAVPSVTPPPVYAPSPVFPQRPAGPPAPPVRARRGMAPALIVVLAVVGVLVLGGGAVGAALLYGGNGPTAGPTGTATAQTAGSGNANANPKGTAKYDLSKLPEDECAVSDATPLYDLFEAELAPASPVRVPNATVNSSSCGYNRVHNRSNPQQQTAALTFAAWAFKDVSVAATSQSGDAETAKLAGPNKSVPGIGEEAIIYETPNKDPQLKGGLTITLAARDSNVRLVVYFIGQRNDGEGWMQKQINDVEERMITAAKNTFAKTTKEMAA
jgi:hypothetical protein